MALSFVQLFPPSQLTAVSGVLFDLTTPASAVLKNLRVRLTNATAAAVPVTLYVAPSATASGPANCCLNAVSIGANGYLDVDIPTMKAGDTFRGLAGTAAAITVHELGGVIYS
jgi:hypothetical protein